MKASGSHGGDMNKGIEVSRSQTLKGPGASGSRSTAPTRAVGFGRTPTRQVPRTAKRPGVLLRSLVTGCLTVALGLALSSCLHSPARLRGYSFDYSLRNREETGLIQV